MTRWPSCTPGRHRPWTPGVAGQHDRVAGRRRTVDGRSAGLGNAADEHLFAVLRDLADVILVGSGTVRAEQYGGIRLDAVRPARRVRWGLPATPPPIAVVTGRGLDPTLPMFTDTVTPPIVITTERRRYKFHGVSGDICGIDRVNFSAAVTHWG